MQLISQPSAHTLLNVAYSGVMEPAGLALFANFSYSSSLPYSVFGLDPGYVRLEDVMYYHTPCMGSVNLSEKGALFFHDGRRLILQSCIANVSVSRSLAMGLDDQTVDFIRLDSDGSIRGYKYDHENATWNAVFDWFANSSNGVCSLPNACGPYGICRHPLRNQSYYECTCPSFQDLNPQPFLAENRSDSHQGCRLVHPLNCTLGEASHYFIELQGVDYFANNVLFSQSMMNRTKQQCVAACARICACKAAFYRTKGGACFLYEQVVSIMGLGNMTQVLASVYDYNKVTANAIGRSPSSKQLLLAGEPVALQAQLSQSSQLGTTHLDDMLNNYVGFLKVQNNSVQSEASLSKTRGRRYLFMTVGSTIAGLFLLGVTCILFYVCCKKRRKFKALGDEDLFAHTLQGQQSMVHFSFSQLQEASGDFKSKLGIGGFGSVYKGTLPNGSIVAIKQLESAIRCNKEFESQVLYLNSLNHPNLVSLIGFCTGGSRRFLVSEYMVNGSLDAWIFHKPINKADDIMCAPTSILDWVTRFTIALDVAKGLAFLHQSNLVHLNVKPQNILLDGKFVAKLSDYGLCRLLDHEEGSLIMHMRGTPGYMAPEWAQHAYATEKSDVYSYGMVLMEILGGRKNVDLSKERENWYFPILAAKMFEEGKVLEVLDEKLTRGKDMVEAECEQARRVLQVAFWCIVENPSKRPDMGSVLLMLQGHQEVLEPPLPLHFGGHNVHISMGNVDDNQPFYNNNQSGSSSPTCFNISFVSEPSSTMAAYSSWSNGGGNLDDCSLLLPSHV